MRFKIAFPFLLLLTATFSYSQDHGFKYGASYKDLDLKYPMDTSAVAFVITEFGEAHWDNGGDYHLLVDYHVRIKILKKEGLKHANIEIPLYKDGSSSERILDVKATSYRYEKGSMVNSELDTKNIFTENQNEHWTVKKIAIPNAVVGGVIEYSYTLDTPYEFNLKTWEFQSDIPKLLSEYWATIPANYMYNISLRGYHQLDKNESAVVKDCYSAGGRTADCSRFKWAMKNVAAFVEEDYMTAKSNFLSSIHFELSEYQSFNGAKTKITKEWKDVAQELKQNDHFGVQLRKAKGVVDQYIDPLITGETDPLVKAKKIFAFVRDWYSWDGIATKYSYDGIKKAFDKKKGNSGDINLTLIAALKYADLEADPMILSTRKNGAVTDLYPVLNDFNYVIAKLSIGDKVYLLDATDGYLPFGVLPTRCLNGKGRVFSEKESAWLEIKPTEKEKRITTMDLKLEEAGTLKGEITITYFGYAAVDIRSQIYDAGSAKEYVNELNKSWHSLSIVGHEIANTDDLEKPITVKLTIEAEVFDAHVQNFLFNPYLAHKWQENPFKSIERSYPVDFGAPREYVEIINLTYPPNFELSSYPTKVGLALPNNGGRFIYNVVPGENKVTLNSSLSFAKIVFNSQEYHYLKEIFNHVVSTQQGDFVFKKK